jgi:DedD protein
MDQTLQARLIGATVLVALAVLLIPELLSGRKTAEPVVEEGGAAKGTRSFTIDLGSPGGQTSVPATPARAAIAPAARMPASQAGEPRTTEAMPDAVTGVEPPDVTPATGPVPSPPTERTTEPAAQPASTAQPPPSSPAQPVQAGGWVVQVGAFGSADAARRLVDDLLAAGFEAHLSPVTRSGRTLHRVRVGPVAGRPAADQLAERLKGRGLPASVIEND